MKITIVGAGAIGGTVGAHLVRAGHDVLLVDGAREHVEAVAGGGLRIEGREEFTVRVPIVGPEGLRDALGGRPADTVLLAVKALHTEAALETVVPVLGPGSAVVSMQNGLNERVIARRIGAARTVGAFVNFGADYLAPGRVLYGGSGALYLGELDGRITPRVEALAAALRGAFLPDTTVTANIWGYLWGKMGYAAMLFATAVTDETMGDVLADPANEALMADLAGEVIGAADAEGVRSEGFDGFDPDAMRFPGTGASVPAPRDVLAPPADFAAGKDDIEAAGTAGARARDRAAVRRSLDALVAHNRASLKKKSGIWRDLAVRRRRTEVDYQLGAVLDVARGRGVELPLNVRLIEMIHELETGRRAMAPENLDVLRRLDAELYGAA